jgi:hypothetical protein
MLFSALHGLLGALVVPAVAGGPVAEICTPNGLQWVALDESPGSSPASPDTDWPQGLAKPCAWAMAQVAVPPEPPASEPLQGVFTSPLMPCCHRQQSSRLPAAAERVLLMAPMRAPPRTA